MPIDQSERERSKYSGDPRLGQPPAVRCRILALAPNYWDDQWMNRQQILSRLAKSHDILYSNGPWSVWERGQERFQAAKWTGSFERLDGVFVDRPPKLLLSWRNHSVSDRAVAQIAVARWRRELARMGTGPIVAYVFHPKYLRYAERLKADLLVYNPFDLFSKMPLWTEQHEAEEQRLLDICSFVIASSEPTRAALQKKTNRRVFLIPNGADAGHFELGSRQPTPPELAAIPRPRIGYVGSLNIKVDYRLLARIAKLQPSWQLVLIGPRGKLDDESRAGFEECGQLPNVHVLGARSLEQLPACMAGLDVALLCYRKDTWMDYGFPLKLYEYLAAGLPIVSTPLQSLRDQHEFVDTADDTSSWCDAIGGALQGRGRSTPELRRAEARRNTWDLRVARINELLATAASGALSNAPSRPSA